MVRNKSAIFLLDNIAKKPYSLNGNWKVTVSNKAAKRSKKMPKNVLNIFEALLLDLMNIGPVQSEWSNYSKLTGGRHHCHLNYSFVAVWEAVDKEIRVLEVTYVGSREDAPY